MLLGQFERTLDDKGRLSIPAELRTRLGPGAVLTRSFDNCLCIYPAAKWESLAQAVDDLPQVRPEIRDLARSLFSGAISCELDRQGRIVVPAYLRQHADLNSDVVIVGVNSRVEIWNPEAWKQRPQFEIGGPRLAEVLSI